MATRAMIKSEDAWRFNDKILNQYLVDGTKEDQALALEFNKTLSRYAEHSLDWDDNVQALTSDAGNFAEQASANQLLDSFNQTRSQFHNQLIKLVVTLDAKSIKDHNERFCNFPIGMDEDMMKSEDNRKLIMDAAFSDYVKAHPNDRPDNKTVQWVKSVDQDLNRLGGVSFKLEIEKMRSEFNENSGLDYQMSIHQGVVNFVNINPAKGSTFKLYSPVELATQLYETGEIQAASWKQRGLIAATLIHAEQNNTASLLKDLRYADGLNVIRDNVKAIADMLGMEKFTDRQIRYVSEQLETWENDRSNPNIALMNKVGYRSSEIVRDLKNLEWSMGNSLDELSRVELDNIVDSVMVVNQEEELRK